MNPLISVIIPIYNVDKYLKECLESLKKQTYPNLEIIMVNDGSTDNSETICKEYEQKQSNFYYYNKTNGGLSDARNYGLEKATGEYIGFIDSDDYVSPLFYQVLYNNLTRSDADISTCAFEMHECKNIIVNNDELVQCSELYNQRDAIKYLFSDTEKFRNFAWNKLYKAECFENITFPVGKKMEDLGTAYKVFLKARKISYNPNKLYFYRQRKNSILHSISASFYKDKLDLELERFIDLKKVYPKMLENDISYLNTFLEAFPFVEKNSRLWKNSEQVFYRASYKAVNKLGNRNKLKYILARISPFVFWSTMRRIKRYE